MDEELDHQLATARQTALDIEDGMKSRYWGYLRRKIEGWLATEKKHLEIMNQRLIRLPEDVEDRNDSVKRIALLIQFLKINETIRDENLGLIGFNVKEFTKPIKQNFVGQKSPQK